MGTELEYGTLYIVNSDGTESMVSEINEAEITYADDYSSNDISRIISSITDLEAAFTVTAKVTKDCILVLTGIKDFVLNLCPDKRVVHLALYAKKKRTRKKNLHRAIRILEE